MVTLEHRLLYILSIRWLFLSVGSPEVQHYTWKVHWPILLLTLPCDMDHSRAVAQIEAWYPSLQNQQLSCIGRQVLYH